LPFPEGEKGMEGEGELVFHEETFIRKKVGRSLYRWHIIIA